MKPEATADIIPLFSTAASLKQGAIFTIDKPGTAKKAGRKYGPINLADFAKDHKLTQLHVVDSAMANFMQLEKNLKAVDCRLTFGLKVVVCDDMADKSETSLRNESNVIIWMAGDGDDDYCALINLYTKAAQDGFYYNPRLDWKTLKAMWHEDLLLALPFYSSFLARNTLTFASIVPDLPAPPLIFQEVGQQMPQDDLIQGAIDRYVAVAGAPVQRVKSVYYKDRKDARQWQMWRCILNRSTWDKPNDSCFSREFCWESYGEITTAESRAELREAA